MSFVSTNNTHHTMGYYIETSSHKDKAAWLLKNCLESHEVPLGTLPEPGFVPVVVMNNTLFEAAGIAFDQNELTDFVYPDGRPKRQIMVRREDVVTLQPYVKSELAWP